MISDIITPLTYHEENQGKYLKSLKIFNNFLLRKFQSSTKYFEWVLQINETRYSIGLEYSYFTGHRAVKINGKAQFEATSFNFLVFLNKNRTFSSSFQYPFKLEKTSLNIIQYGDTFELRINNEPFSHMYSQVKTQSLFKFEDEAAKEEEEQAKQQYKLALKLKSQSQKESEDQKKEEKINFNFNNFVSKPPVAQTPEPKNTDPFNFSMKNEVKDKNIWSMEFKSFQEFGQKQQQQQQPVQNQFDFAQPQQKKQQEAQSNLLDIFDSAQEQQPNAIQKPSQQPISQQATSQQPTFQQSVSSQPIIQQPQQTNIWESFGNANYKQSSQPSQNVNTSNPFSFQAENQPQNEIDFNQQKAQQKNNITSLYDNNNNNNNNNKKDINAVWDLLDTQLEANQIPNQQQQIPQQIPNFNFPQPNQPSANSMPFQHQQFAQQQSVYQMQQQPSSKNPFDF